MNPNPYSLNHEEVETLDFLTEERAIALLTSSQNHVGNLLVKTFILGELAKGRTFIIRTEDVQRCAGLLDQWDLSDLKLILKKDTLISKSDLDKKTIEDRTYQIEAIKSHTRYQKSLEALRKVQTLYNEKVFGEYSRPKLSELRFLSKTRQSLSDIDLDVSYKNYTYGQEEFWALRGRVEKASKYFKSSYNFLKSSDEFCDSVYKDFHLGENQKIVFKYLSKFLKDTESLCKRYKSSFQEIHNALYSKYLQQIQKIKKQSQDLDLYLSFYQIEYDLAGKNKVFGRGKDPLEVEKKELRSRYQVLLDAIEGVHLFKVKCPENSWNPDVVELTKFNGDLQKLLSSAHQIIQSKVEEQLEIINARNYSAPNLIDIQAEQEDLIHAINGSQLFRTEIHNLSISSWKNYEFLKHLRNRLIKNKVFLEANMDYAIYRSFEFSIDKKTNDLISALHSTKSHKWVEAFETWYFKALFDKHFLHELIDLEIKYLELEEQKHENAEHKAFRISHVFKQLRYSKNQLAKKIGKDGLDWKSAIISDSDGFKYNFPIIICDTEFFASELDNLNYDYLICEENKEIPTNLFANTHFSSIVCLSARKFERSLVEKARLAKNYGLCKEFKIKSSGLAHPISLQDGAKSKLLVAKYLSSVLKEASSEIKFFSAKNFSIISCMSDFCMKLLEIELQELRIKALKFTHLESGIVEDVLIKEDDSKYLVIQDGFIDSNKDIEWQITALRLLSQAGIHICYLNSFALANSESKRVLDFLNIKELVKDPIAETSYEP